MIEVRRILVLASRWVAILACGFLGVELVRSFFSTDTICVFPIAVVTDRGSVIVLTNLKVEYLYASEPVVAGVRPWPIQKIPYAPWERQQVLGVNGWFDDAFILIKLPILMVLPVPALFLLWWHRRRADYLLRRTYYLACPTCGYELAGVAHAICPECGAAVVSRVIEAVPASAGLRRARLARDASRSLARG